MKRGMFVMLYPTLRAVRAHIIGKSPTCSAAGIGVKEVELVFSFRQQISIFRHFSCFSARWVSFSPSRVS